MFLNELHFFTLLLLTITFHETQSHKPKKYEKKLRHCYRYWNCMGFELNVVRQWAVLHEKPLKFILILSQLYFSRCVPIFMMHFNLYIYWLKPKNQIWKEDGSKIGKRYTHAFGCPFVHVFVKRFLAWLINSSMAIMITWCRKWNELYSFCDDTYTVDLSAHLLFCMLNFESGVSQCACGKSFCLCDRGIEIERTLSEPVLR